MSYVRLPSHQEAVKATSVVVINLVSCLVGSIGQAQPAVAPVPQVEDGGPDAVPPAPPDARALFGVAMHWNPGGDTPLGFFGIALDVSPIDRLSVEMGVGWPGNYTAGYNFALMPRYTLLQGSRWAFELGGAFSRGHHTWSNYQGYAGGSQRIWDAGYRVDAQAQVDLKVWSKLHLALYGGLGWMLSDPARTFSQCLGPGGAPVDCTSAQLPGPDTGRDVRYFGVALRYSLARRPEQPDVWGRWYGWQVIAFDAAAGLLEVAASRGANTNGSLGDRNLNAPAGLLLFSLAAPIVHVEHRRPGAALVSLGARVGAMLISFAVLSNAIQHESSGSLIGLVGAPVAVSVLDAGLLAWEPKDRSGDLAAAASAAP
jgi:hypothetical protein